jgi:hypothetical protein
MIERLVTGAHMRFARDGGARARPAGRCDPDAQSPAGSLAQETALELDAEADVALDAVAAQMVQDDPVGLAPAAGREGREPAAPESAQWPGAGGRGQAAGKRKRGHGGLLPGEWAGRFGRRVRRICV